MNSKILKYHIFYTINNHTIQLQTTTDSTHIAHVAYNYLLDLITYRTEINLSVVITENDKEIKKFNITQHSRRCENCNVFSDFIDDGETCPACYLVQ